MGGLRLNTFCDASFGTRCFGGYKVKLTGSRGTSFLIQWASRLQGPQSTSSTESESIERGRAAKATLRVKEALDACRLKPVPCDGQVDNDALRLAVQRGSSAKLGHLRVHAETCFRLLAQVPISLHRVGTTENEADIMTKVLSAVGHRELCKTDFDLDAVPEAASCLTQRCVDTLDGEVWDRQKMFSRARALQLNFWASCLVRESRDGVCSRRVTSVVDAH